MIWVIFAYIITTIIVLTILRLLRFKHVEIKNAHIFKYGIIFKSTARHRLFVGDAKMLVVENNVYLKLNKKVVVIKRVANAEIKKGYVYFTSLGETKIIVNIKEIYKYFCIVVQSNAFNLQEIRAMAINEMLADVFNFKNGKAVKRYLNIVKNILKIDLQNNCVKVSRNRFNLHFSLIYKLHNKTKKINV